ncbi:MAG: glutathione peroxidase [Burkholderiales bacterium]|nr:glutathione peroxidase [Burkholderiales bacterium]
MHTFLSSGAPLCESLPPWPHAFLPLAQRSHRPPLPARLPAPQPPHPPRGKVVLVVNTASFCGFTPQYKGLEALDSKYRARGLVVLGFPSNDFAQESGSNKEIADFCESTFGVKFPMFAKSSVRGANANPLFKQLALASGTTPKWNFYKYLIGRDGKVVQAWSSMTAPDESAFVKVIESQLAAGG